MKYFTLTELCKSQTAKRLNIDNTPNEQVTANLERLVHHVLDPLREAWGKPIIVNSGYRSPALNKAVGGVPGSQHLTGEAADITAGSKENNKKLFEMLQDKGLPFDQLIDEKGYSWLHVSYREEKNRNQVLHL